MALLNLISDLQASLGKGKVFAPNCSEYDQALKRWASSIEKPAGVVVYPSTSQDVSTAVKLANKHSISFTVVCGGHGTSGDSSTAGGLLLNLRRLNAVSVSPQDLTVTCAGGCLWSETDAAAATHNLSTVGGTVNQTGVAGYTTGGGFGFMTGQHGLAIDNLLSAEIVLADGRIATCSATQEPDLFWAIRGAGHMFGIITSFTFRAYHQPNPVYGGLVLFPPSPVAIEHLITFANNIQASSDGRTAMFCGFTTPPATPGKRAVFGCCFHDGPEEEGWRLFAPLIENSPVPAKHMLRAMPYREMNEVLAVAAAREGRRVSKGACYEGPLPPRVFIKILDMYEAFVANECPDAGESGACLFEFYPLDAVMRIGSRDTAFVNRVRHNNAMIIPWWNDEKYDDVARRFAREAMETLKREVSKEGKESGEYLNYDGLGTGPEKVFGENYERLRILKERYDPENRFDKRAGLRAAGKCEVPQEGPRREEAAEKREDDETAESSSSISTPPPDYEQAVTHEILISAKSESEWSKTQEILKEVRKATAKLQGINIAVSVTSLADDVHSD